MYVFMGIVEEKEWLQLLYTVNIISVVNIGSNNISNTYFLCWLVVSTFNPFISQVLVEMSRSFPPLYKKKIERHIRNLIISKSLKNNRSYFIKQQRFLLRRTNFFLVVGGWSEEKKLFARGYEAYIRDNLTMNLINLQFPGKGVVLTPHPTTSHIKKKVKPFCFVSFFRIFNPTII